MSNNIQLHCELTHFNSSKNANEFILYPTECMTSPFGSLITLFHTTEHCEFTNNIGEHINFFAATSKLHNNQNDFKKFLLTLSTSLLEIIKTVKLDHFNIDIESHNSNYKIMVSRNLR